MEKQKKNSKYRVRAVVRNPLYGNDVLIRYVIQKKKFLGWWTLSDEIKDENEANRMVEKLIKYDEL